MIRPGMFGKSYAADARRTVFGYQNHQILASNKTPDCVFIGDSIIEHWMSILTIQNILLIVVCAEMFRKLWQRDLKRMCFSSSRKVQCALSGAMI